MKFSNLEVLTGLLERQKLIKEKLERLNIMKGRALGKGPKWKTRSIEFGSDYVAHAVLHQGGFAEINDKIVLYTVELLEEELLDIEEKLEQIDKVISVTFQGGIVQEVKEEK